VSWGEWGLMTTINYSRMDDIFPDDHYVGHPLFVDPEMRAQDIGWINDTEDHSLEIYLKYPERIRRELEGYK
jgi:hypothetical protein